MKENIENIISNLIDATKSGGIIWKDISDSSNFKYERKLESYKGNKELRDLLKDLYCKDLNPTINDLSDIFDDISKKYQLVRLEILKLIKYLNE